MGETLSYLNINNHIFQTNGIGAVSFNDSADGRVEMHIFYNVGHSLCIIFEKKEECKEAFEKIGEALKAK